jgi:hypothetical protein
VTTIISRYPYPRHCPGKCLRPGSSGQPNAINLAVGDGKQTTHKNADDLGIVYPLVMSNIAIENGYL